MDNVRPIIMTGTEPTNTPSFGERAKAKLAAAGDKAREALTSDTAKEIGIGAAVVTGVVVISTAMYALQLAVFKRMFNVQ